MNGGSQTELISFSHNHTQPSIYPSSVDISSRLAANTQLRLGFNKLTHRVAASNEFVSPHSTQPSTLIPHPLTHCRCFPVACLCPAHSSLAHLALMTAIPLIVTNEPPEWVLLDLQGDISLRRMALGGGSQAADRAQPNAIHTYSGLELGVFKQHNVCPPPHYHSHSRSQPTQPTPQTQRPLTTPVDLCCWTVLLAQGKLQLRIGNHMLSCQLVTLKKPFVVLQRARHMHKQPPPPRSNMQTDESSDDELSHSTAVEGGEDVGLYCVAVIRQKVLVNTRPAPIIVGQTAPMPVLM